MALAIETNLYSWVERGGLDPLQKNGWERLLWSKGISNDWDHVFSVKAKNKIQYKPKKKSMKNNQGELIQYNTTLYLQSSEKKKEKESVKTKNLWGIRAHTFLHYTLPATLPSCPWNHLEGQEKALLAHFFGQSLYSLRNCEIGRQVWRESAVLSLPLSGFWENTELSLPLFPRYFCFHFWIM